MSSINRLTHRITKSVNRVIPSFSSSSINSSANPISLSTPSFTRSFSSPPKRAVGRVAKVYSAASQPEFYSEDADEEWLEDPIVAQFDSSDATTSPSSLAPGNNMALLKRKIESAEEEFQSMLHIPDQFEHNYHNAKRLEAMSKKYDWVDYNRFAEYMNQVDKNYFDNDEKMVGEHWTNRDDISPKVMELEYQSKKALLEQQIEDYKLRTILTTRIYVDSGSNTKVTRQGKQRSSWALMVAGDGNGTIGFGFGKAEDLKKARLRAWTNVKRNLLFVPLIESRTILHRVTGKHGVCEVQMRPLPRGHGLTAGTIPRIIFNAAGIRDISANVRGRALRKHQVLACFDGLKGQSSIRELAIARGLNPYRLFDPGLERYQAPTRTQMREKFNDLQLRLMGLARTMGFDHELGRFVRNPDLAAKAEEGKEGQAAAAEEDEEEDDEPEEDKFADYLNRDTTPLSHGYGQISPPNAVPSIPGKRGVKL